MSRVDKVRELISCIKRDTTSFFKYCDEIHWLIVEAESEKELLEIHEILKSSDIKELRALSVEAAGELLLGYDRLEKLNYILNTLNDPSACVRREAATTLLYFLIEKSSSPRLVKNIWKYVVNRTWDDCYEVRSYIISCLYRCARRLGGKYNKDALKILHEIVLKDTWRDNRLKASAFYVSLKEEIDLEEVEQRRNVIVEWSMHDKIDKLLELLEKGDIYSRVIAATSLIRHVKNNAKVKAALSRLINDPYPDLRLCSAEALLKVDSMRAKKYLFKLLRDPNDGIKMDSADYLYSYFVTKRKLNLSELKQLYLALLDLTESWDSLVRSCAKDLLILLTKRKSGDHIKQ